ncbi:hypothetical protein D1AOALGA4SA_3053 [Olavius algarvensis Delta 1 endosymbiont]|nr:hypothetical protein D1AOALGA4SA_3053 [Olavius algarvensis Delta 1 endosymbiont]
MPVVSFCVERSIPKMNERSDSTIRHSSFVIRHFLRGFKEGRDED